MHAFGAFPSTTPAPQCAFPNTPCSLFQDLQLWIMAEERVHSFSKSAKTALSQNPLVGLVLGSDGVHIQPPLHAPLAIFSIVIKNCHGIHLTGNVAFAPVPNLGPADFFSKKLLMEGGCCLSAWHFFWALSSCSRCLTNTWGSLGFSPAKRSHCRCSLLAFLVALVVPEPKGIPFLFLGPSGGSISDFSKSEMARKFFQTFLKLWDFPNPNGFSKPKGLFQATCFSKPVAAARLFPRPPTAQLLEAVWIVICCCLKFLLLCCT